MTNSLLQIKRSGTSSAVPASLAFGELAINYSDGVIFYKHANGTIASLSSGGGNNFGTVDADGTLLVSDTTGDVLTILGSQDVLVVGDAATDTLRIFANNVSQSFDKANAALANTNNATFGGNLIISGALLVTVANTAPLDIPGEVAEFVNSANGYVQVHLRNANTLVRASADYVITGDTGSDTLDFLDLGLNNSTYSDPNWTINGPRDGYLYMSHGNLAIGTANVSRSLVFFTGGLLAANERARFDPTGNLLIGRVDSTIGQSVKLDIAGAINASAVLVNGTAVGGATTTLDTVDATRYLVFDDATTGSFTLANTSTSLTYNPSTGTLSATIFNSTSDIKKKKNIVQIKSALDITESLRGVRFKWKDNGNPSMGVIAQEVEKVLPELVDDNKSVNYNGIIGVLIEAIKELKLEINELKTKYEKERE